MGLKVISIILAGALWLIVSGEQIVERALRIPLEFTNLPSQLELVGDAPNLVDVRVRGSSGALSRIASGELVAVIEASEVELQNRGLDLAERFFEERPRDFGHRLGSWLQQWLRGEAPTVADALVCHDASVLN